VSRVKRLQDTAKVRSMPVRAANCEVSPGRQSIEHSLVRLCLILLTLSATLLPSVGCRTQEGVLDVAGDLYVPSAADHYPEALDRAMDWKTDAHLISIAAGVECPNSPYGGPSITFYFDAPSAPNSILELDLTEGVWRSRVVELSSGATISAPIEREQWTLDSVDAWTIAQANGGEEFLFHYHDPTTIMAVILDHWPMGGGGELLVWRANYMIPPSSSLDILIDPRTGDIIEVEERSMSGTLVATTPNPPPTPWATLPACTPVIPEAGATTGLPERIAFESSREAMSHIFLMNPDGSNVEQVTDGPDADSDAAWSPDGRRVAFTRMVGLNIDIYVVDADGANLRRLTDHPGYDRGPTWSPDGSRIAFSSDRDGNYNLYIMDADGSNLTPLTDHPATDDSPDWSPDGCRIAFVSGRDHWPESHIYIVNVDGSNLTQLTEGSTLDYEPRWSPDGTRIAFWSQPIGEAAAQPNVYVMDEDGAGKVRLTTGSCGGYRPVWSPDGTRIAFSIGRDDPLGSDIFVMDADGLNVVQLTDEPGSNRPCSWRR
jgi:Tol biopolymer transport system component